MGRHRKKKARARMKMMANKCASSTATVAKLRFGSQKPETVNKIAVKNDSKPDKKSPRVEAIKKLQSDSVGLLKSDQEQPNETESIEVTSLTLAVLENDIEMVKEMIDDGSDILEEDVNGTTALCMSIVNKRRNITELFFSNIDEDTRHRYVNSRICLLQKPKDTCPNVERFYVDVLLTVLLELRKNMKEGAELFQRYKVFHALMTCAQRYRDRPNLLRVIFHLCANIMFYKNTTPSLLVDGFIESGGPLLSMRVFIHGSPGCTPEVKRAAVLPIHAMSFTESGRSWLKSNLLQVYMYLVDPTDFFLDTWCHGDETMVEMAYERFKKVLAELIEERDKETLSGNKSCIKDISADEDQKFLPHRDSAYAEALKKNLSRSEWKSNFQRLTKSPSRRQKLTVRRKPLNETTHRDINESVQEQRFTPHPSEDEAQGDRFRKMSLEDEATEFHQDEVSGDCSSFLSADHFYSEGSTAFLSQGSGDYSKFDFDSQELQSSWTFGNTERAMNKDLLQRTLDLQKWMVFLYDTLCDLPSEMEPESLLKYVAEQFQAKKMSLPKAQKELFSDQSTCDMLGTMQGSSKVLVSNALLKDSAFTRCWRDCADVVETYLTDGSIDRDVMITSLQNFAVVLNVELGKSHLKETQNSISTLLDVWNNEDKPVGDGDNGDGNDEELAMERSSRWYHCAQDLVKLVSGSFQAHDQGNKQDLWFYSNKKEFMLRASSLGTYLSVYCKKLPGVLRELNPVLTPRTAELLQLVKIGKIQHPNLVQIYECAVGDNGRSVCVMSELCEYSLTEYLKVAPDLHLFYDEVVDSRFLVKQLIEAIHYLHSLCIVHGRLKPSNVFVTYHHKLKVGDFYLNDVMPPLFGSQSANSKQTLSHFSWRPQELISARNAAEAKASITKASDVQMLGMLIYYIFTRGKHPFGKTDVQCQCRMKIGRYELNEMPRDLIMRDMVEEMLRHTPHKRITISKIYQHPTFWADAKKLQFLVEIRKNLSLIQVHSAYTYQMLQQSCLESRDWTKNVDRKFWTCLTLGRRYDDGLSDLLQFAADLMKHQLPDDMRFTFGTPFGYLHHQFRATFASLYAVLRNNRILQRQLRLHRFFYNNN